MARATTHKRARLIYCTADVLLPVDLSVLVEVLQAFQHILQHSGYGGLVQDAGLVFPSGDDVLDHIQHRAWILTTTEKRFAVAVLRFAGIIASLVVNIHVRDKGKLSRNGRSCCYFCP